ncbi:diguanylate cyclase domain-containing protein [Deinococcus sp. JMULE3]|uniref:sensor domain-containing diguanylate cyclase n=1 Tax=Deinococcus sp. JMULE3 TaxID=2518341 RepID=UPI0015756842|nr:diguanylate cyclase [Deinococcus sp. JMULE3]NTY00309.1 sensor domain-containing diguanylate cyclase [Deinococcus sp. JMULE3]
MRARTSRTSERRITTRRAARQPLKTRLWLLLALLLTQGLTLLVALVGQQQLSGQAQRAQAQAALEQLVRVTSDNVQGYLRSAAQIVQVNRTNVQSGLLSADDPSGTLTNFHALLDNVPQLNGMLVGHADGRFTFLRRDGPGDTGRYSRVIEVRPQRRVTTTRYDARGLPTSQSSAPSDYDPRTRPWYRQAQAQPGRLVWTEPYVFASSQQPGVTVAASAAAPGGTVVVGADVQLRQLASFLQGLQVSARGRAFVTDAGGHAIAASREWPVTVQGRVPLLREVADPALRALLDDRSRLTPGRGTHWFQVGGEPYGVVLQPFEVQPGVTWTVGVYAPTADFPGPARPRPLAFVLLISLAGSLLAWLLVLRATRPIEALQRQATTDPLTGLPNRASFLAQLEETRAGGGLLAVAIFDLDGFKSVNDTFGHHAGDEVLHAVGARMLAALRAGDTLGRLGGDEFALLVQATSREEIRLRVEGALQAIARQPVVVDGVPHDLNATAGLAFHEAGRGGTVGQLLARADTALIRGKRRGKGRVWLDGEVTMPTLFR